MTKATKMTKARQLEELNERLEDLLCGAVTFLSHLRAHGIDHDCVGMGALALFEKAIDDARPGTIRGLNLICPPSKPKQSHLKRVA